MAGFPPHHEAGSAEEMTLILLAGAPTGLSGKIVLSAKADAASGLSAFYEGIIDSRER